MFWVGFISGIGITLFIVAIYACLVVSGKEDRNERD